MTVIDIFLLVLNKYFLSCLCCRNKLVQQVDPVVAENQLSDCKYNINKKCSTISVSTFLQQRNHYEDKKI